jgi:small subunit ribosomal protein S16
MVRIRLRRIGGKNQASFRIVAADKESPRNGRFIEILGFYNPRTEPATISLKEDRIYHWISKGAQPSDSATQIFNLAGLTGRYERFKTGEKVETLVAEADAAAKSRTTNLRTNRAAPAAGSSRRKAAAREAAAAAVAAAPPAVAPVAAPEAEAPAEAPIAEASAEAPVAEASAEAPAGDAPAAEAPAAE